MESRNRYAIPAEHLETVRVDDSEQVQEQAQPRPTESSLWNAPMPHPFGDGATHADADGD